MNNCLGNEQKVTHHTIIIQSIIMASKNKTKLLNLKTKSVSNPTIFPQIQSAPSSPSSPIKEMSSGLFSSSSMHQKLRLIHKNYSSLNPNDRQNNIPPLSKDKLISSLSMQLSSKLNMDQSSREQLSIHEQNKLKKLPLIEYAIKAINQQNILRLKELEELELRFINKIQEEIKKDKQQEEKLKQQYAKVLLEGEKIILAKEVKKIKQKQDWNGIMRQERNIELIARELQKKQEFIAKEKTHVFKEKAKSNQKVLEKKQLQEEKSVKKERKKKNAEQLKEMGRQYLEHAKKAQTEKAKAKIKLLDVYKKSIDYLPEIKSILVLNAQDLSKVPDPQSLMNISLMKSRKKVKNSNGSTIIGSSSMKSIGGGGSDQK